MKEEIKKISKRFGIYWIKTMETYCVTCKKNISYKVIEKLKKINQYLYQIVVRVVRKIKVYQKPKSEQIIDEINNRNSINNITLIGDTLFEGTCFLLIIFEMLIK